MDVKTIIALKKEVEDLFSRVSHAAGARDALQAQMNSEEESLRKAGVNVDALDSELEHMGVEITEGVQEVRERLTTMGVIGG